MVLVSRGLCNRKVPAATTDLYLQRLVDIGKSLQATREVEDHTVAIRGCGQSRRLACVL